jgi:hypothetical protein
MDIKGCPRPGRHISHTWLDDGWRCICIGDGVPMRNGLPPALSPGADVLARRLLDVLDEHSQAEIDPAVAAAAQELGRAIRWQGMDWAEVLPAPAQAWQHAAATDIAPSGQLPVAVCGRGPTDIGASYVVVPKEGHVTCPDCRQALRRDERPRVWTLGPYHGPRDEQPFAIDALGADHPALQEPVKSVNLMEFRSHPQDPCPGPPVCIEDLEHWHTSTASHVKIVIPGNPPSYQRSRLPRTVVECPGPFGHNFDGIPAYPPCKEKAAHWHALDDAGALWTIPGEVPDGLHP